MEVVRTGRGEPNCVCVGGGGKKVEGEEGRQGRGGRGGGKAIEIGHLKIQTR